jgi:hypothetical protein
MNNAFYCVVNGPAQHQLLEASFRHPSTIDWRPRMRGIKSILACLIVAAALAGCVYDPGYGHRSGGYYGNGYSGGYGGGYYGGGYGNGYGGGYNDGYGGGYNSGYHHPYYNH